MLIADAEAGRVIATNIASTNALLTSIFTSHVIRPQSIAIDERRGVVLVADLLDVKSFSLHGGDFLGTFLSDSTTFNSNGGLHVGLNPFEDREIFVSIGNSNLVKSFNGTSGAFLQNVATSKLSKPSGFAFLSRASSNGTPSPPPPKTHFCLHDISNQ